MRRPASLWTILVTTILSLVIVAVIGVGLRAVVLLQRLAEEQALARVDLAGLAALRELEQVATEIDTTARLLAERPTLRRHLELGARAPQQQFLERFSRTSGVDGCAAILAGVRVAGGDPGVPWDRISDLAQGAAGWLLIPGAPGAAPVLAAAHPVEGIPGAQAAVARFLGAAFESALGGSVGLPVAIVSREEARSGAGDPVAALRGRAADEAVGGSTRSATAGAFVNVRPFLDRSRNVAALVETRLPTESVDASVRHLAIALLASTLAVAALAALAALLIARRIVRPLESLTAASARIGRGDLTTAIPRTGGQEVGILASTMEEMRVRLLHLTAELRRRQAEAESILGGIVEGVWAVDRERRITWLNPQGAALLGIRRDEAIGRFCGDVLGPVTSGGERPCDEECPILDARFRGSARAVETLDLGAGRRRKVVITSAPPAGSEEGGDTAFQQVQILRDETDVEAARRLRDTILANVSHEFRTPLSAQLASLEMLRDRLGEPSTADLGELLRPLERGTLRLARLVDNLLESLRIEAGLDTIRRQEVHLDQVVEEAVEATAPLIEQKGQRLEMDLPWPLPPVQGDAARLVQVFVNLLANAHKFAPADSRIRVGGEVSTRVVSVWVDDQGPGLPEEAGDQLFEPFLRARGEEPEESGMGLGLWIVRSIVTRHGGRVEARNTQQGARVSVVLPRPETPGGDPDGK